MVATKPLKTQIGTLLKDASANSIDDLADAYTSKAQINKAKQIVGLLDNVDDNISVPDLWKIRKEFDKKFYSTRWSQDMDKFLKGVRQTLKQTLLRV